MDATVARSPNTKGVIAIRPANFYSVSERTRRSRRRVYSLTLCAAAMLVGACAAPRINYVASGPPSTFPADGAFVPAGVEDFDSIVVGARGKALVVNVWASWCGPCRVEAPLLARASRRYSQVRFLGIDSKDSDGAGRSFVARYRLPYPNLFDPDGAIADNLRVRGFPTTVVFNRAGKPIASVVGGISERTLAAVLVSATK